MKRAFRRHRSGEAPCGGFVREPASTDQDDDLALTWGEVFDGHIGVHGGLRVSLSIHPPSGSDGAHARDEGLRVTTSCWFIDMFIDEGPQYQDLRAS